MNKLMNKKNTTNANEKAARQAKKNEIFASYCAAFANMQSPYGYYLSTRKYNED